MLSRTTLILTLSAALTAASAQTTIPAGGHARGIVTAENVYVRSAPQGYPCARLSYPAEVTVVGKRGGWLKILPPKGCYSLISKQFVRAEGDVQTRAIGTVTGTNVQVRAGSDLHPARIDRIQTKLDTGWKVTIIGQREGYYKIVPPPGVYLWISGRYVKRIAPAPGVTAATQPTTQPVTGTVLVATTMPGRIKSDLAALEAAEEALVAEFKKPRAQRNFHALLEKYLAITPAGDSPLKPYLEGRIKFIRDEIQLVEDVRQAAEIVRDAEARQAKLAAERERIKAATPPIRPIPAYTAEGVLRASELFTGGATGPKRYILRDPQTHLILAYVQCTTGAVDLSKHVGDRVGIAGSSQYDEAVRLYVIETERLTVISPAPTPPARPAPQPAPKPAPAEVPTTRPAPPEMTAPTTKPAPRPRATTGITVKPDAKAKPAPQPATKPAPGEAPALPAKPSPSARPATQPATQPATKPATRPTSVEAPTTRPAPPEMTAPTTKPAPRPRATTGITVKPEAKAKPAVESLPDTGLPMVEPATKPAEATQVDPDKYQ